MTKFRLMCLKIIEQAEVMRKCVKQTSKISKLFAAVKGMCFVSKKPG